MSSNRRGFTITETLISVAVSGLVLAGGVLAFNRLNGLQREGEASLEMKRGADRVLMMIQRDLEDAIRLNGETTDTASIFSARIYGVMPFPFESEDRVEGIQIIKSNDELSLQSDFEIESIEANARNPIVVVRGDFRPGREQNFNENLSMTMLDDLFVISAGAEVELYSLSSGDQDIRYNRSTNRTQLRLNKPIPSTISDWVGTEFNPKIFRVQRVIYRMFRMPDGSFAKGLWRGINGPDADFEMILENATSFEVRYELRAASTAENQSDCSERNGARWFAHSSSTRDCSWNDISSVKVQITHEKDGPNKRPIQVETSAEGDVMAYKMVLQ